MGECVRAWVRGWVVRREAEEAFLCKCLCVKCVRLCAHARFGAAPSLTAAHLLGEAEVLAAGRQRVQAGQAQLAARVVAGRLRGRAVRGLRVRGVRTKPSVCGRRGRARKLDFNLSPVPRSGRQCAAEQTSATSSQLPCLLFHWGKYARAAARAALLRAFKLRCAPRRRRRSTHRPPAHS